MSAIDLDIFSKHETHLATSANKILMEASISPEIPGYQSSKIVVAEPEGNFSYGSPTVRIAL